MKLASNAKAFDSLISFMPIIYPASQGVPRLFSLIPAVSGIKIRTGGNRGLGHVVSREASKNKQGWRSSALPIYTGGPSVALLPLKGWEGRLNRIGPHNKNIIEIVFGSLLGNAQAELKKNNNGTRITFYQEGRHVKYSLWLHDQLAEAGYCSSDIPKIGKILGKKGELKQVIRFCTWTYTSFNWIHDLWYVNNVKIVPKSIGEYLTPLALSIWIMDAGTRVSGGLKLSTGSFSYSDCLLLSQVLYSNFGLKSSVKFVSPARSPSLSPSPSGEGKGKGKGNGVPSGSTIYIWKECMVELRDIVAPHTIPEMKYKTLL